MNELVAQSHGDTGMRALLSSVDPDALALGCAQMLQLESKEQGMVVAMTCMVRNIDPITFMQQFHIIKGKPAMKTSVMLAKFREAGGDSELVESSPTRAAVKLTDKRGRTWDFALTWEQLKESRWPWKDPKKPREPDNLKSNYSTPLDRQNMLWARLISSAIDRIAPEIAPGIGAPDEAGDYEEASLPESIPVVATHELAGLESDPSEAAGGEVVDAVVESPGEAPSESTPFDYDDDATIRGKCGKAQRSQLRALIKQGIEADELTMSDVEASCAGRGVTRLTQLTREQADQMIASLKGFLGN